MNTLRLRLAAGACVALVLAGQVALVGAAPTGLKPPPPTPVDGRPSAFQTTLATPADALHQPEVGAAAAVLVDLQRGVTLYEKAPVQPRPVASLTKVMTALLALENAEPSDEVVVDPRAVFDPGDYGAGSTLGLRAGERVTVENLLYALLLGSANDAAVALAIHLAGSQEAFVGMMNERAAELGMTATEFRSPNGLDDRGKSSVADLVRLVQVVDGIPEFRRIEAARFRTIPAPRGPDRRIQNRNVLLWLYPGADGMKTGYTYGAGYCLIATAERDGRRLAVIVLDAPREAFSTAAALLNHGFEAFAERTFVAEGEQVGDVALPGGSVPVVAGLDLTGLVSAADAGKVRTRIRVAASAAFPPAPGEQVATLVVTVGGEVVGTVPLLAATVPPPESSEGPWWLRASSAVAGAVADVIGAIAD